MNNIQHAIDSFMLTCKNNEKNMTVNTNRLANHILKLLEQLKHKIDATLPFPELKCAIEDVMSTSKEVSSIYLYDEDDIFYDIIRHLIHFYQSIEDYRHCYIFKTIDKIYENIIMETNER